ncbi:hypothetical protein [Salinimicrobium sp. TH3]|uniref:hypothetical protein n=1 Tax=Salinimicrobium sp. TH3 TaxID=2997342 RepID=UPI002275DF4A|nr:hypothetical protein [Salinimicrobium sp. TH3]MCY2687564.1 hypothetical protein [Salinimicrobium sp. TH3]
MKEYKKTCVCCSEPFWTIHDFQTHCFRVTCEETGKLLEIEQAMDRLVRVVTAHTITTKTGRKHLKYKANFLINRNKNRYITVTNLPKGRNGITAKFDIVTKEVVYRSFDDLSKNR